MALRILSLMLAVAPATGARDRKNMERALNEVHLRTGGEFDGTYECKSDTFPAKPKLTLEDGGWSLSTPNPVGSSMGDLKCLSGNICEMYKVNEGPLVGEINFSYEQVTLKDFRGTDTMFQITKCADKFCN